MVVSPLAPIGSHRYGGYLSALTKRSPRSPGRGVGAACFGHRLLLFSGWVWAGVGRRKLVRLTPRGAQALALSAESFARVRARWAAELGPDRVASMEADLRTMAAGQPPGPPRLARRLAAPPSCRPALRASCCYLSSSPSAYLTAMSAGTSWLFSGINRTRLTNKAIVGEQIAGRRELASDRFELNRRQAVEEPSSAAGDPRRYHQPEFVDDAASEQRLRHRDTCVDADVASALLPEIPDGFDQPAAERRRIGPVPVKGRRCRDMLRDPVDECREWLDLAARPELRPLGVATAAENDRVLRRDHSGKVGVHRFVPVGDETIRVLGNPVEGQQLVHDDLPHALRLHWSRCYWLTDQAAETHRCVESVRRFLLLSSIGIVAAERERRIAL